MKAKAILDYFLTAGDKWVDRRSTVDRIVVGDPNREVSRCLVTWMSGFPACREAAKRGVDLLITHEPTFWDPHDREPEKNPTAAKKLAFIQDAGFAVMRIHDVWDRMPEVGVPSAWGRFLELGDKPARTGNQGYQHLYEIEPTPLDTLAKRIAEKTATIGEAAVQVVGDGQRPVSRIGVGAGCACDIPTSMALAADCTIVADDGATYWQHIQMAADHDHPIIRVNHGTSEEPGMVTLCDYINANLEGVAAEHLPHGCAYRLVGST